MFNYELLTKESEKGSAKTTLRAKFRFKDEVSPNKRGGVRDRLSYDKTHEDYEFNYTRNNCPVDNIVLYLISKNFQVERGNNIWSGGSPIEYFKKYIYNNPDNFSISKTIQCKLKTHPRRLRLNLSVNVKGKADLEEIINLEELNKFIITGEYTKRESRI